MGQIAMNSKDVETLNKNESLNNYFLICFKDKMIYELLHTMSGTQQELETVAVTNNNEIGINHLIVTVDKTDLFLPWFHHSREKFLFFFLESVFSLFKCIVAALPFFFFFWSLPKNVGSQNQNPKLEVFLLFFMSQILENLEKFQFCLVF